MKCEKCGTEMKHYIDGSSQIAKCPNCGFAWATTYIDPIHEDDTVYSVIIEQGNDADVKTVMEIKRFTNLPNPEIINILKNGNYVLVKLNAVDVKGVIKRLNDLKIKHKVEPEFKW